MGENVFSKIFHRCYSSVGTGLEKACTAMLLARHLQGLELPFILGAFPQLPLKYSTVQLWFTVTSGEPQELE